MVAPLSSLLPSAPPPPPVVLLPGDHFFVRQIELSEGIDPAEQVELALEGLSPFSLGQIYHGFLQSADKRQALVYAAYRKRFSLEETDEWDDAVRVLPDFVALFGARPKEGAGVVVHETTDRVTVLGWKESDALPSVILVREREFADIEQLTAEAVRRMGLARTPALHNVSGELTGELIDDNVLQLSGGAELTFGLVPEAQDAADVRDQAFLAERRRQAKRDHWLWRSLQVCACLFLLTGLVEVTGHVLKWQVGKLNQKATDQSELVQRIETAQTLANRISELSEKRLMPMEMLAIINPVRPGTIEFQRAVTTSMTTLDIEASTNNAADVGLYETALKKLPAVASVQTRDIRSRNNVTTFILSVNFKPEVLKNGGAL